MSSLVDTSTLGELRVKIFADAADLDSLRELSADPLIPR